MNSKMKGNNRIRAKIDPRRSRQAPPPIPTSLRDAKLMKVFAGGGLFDSGGKDENSQIFATTLFSENSPLLKQEEVKEVVPIGKREDSSVLFSLKLLANPTGKGKVDQSLIDPISGMIDLGRLVAAYPTAARNATDSAMYINGAEFPVLAVIPKRTGPLIKAAAIFGAALVLVVLVVLSTFALTQDDGFDFDNAGKAQQLAGLVPLAAVPRADENTASQSTPSKVEREAGKQERQSVSLADSRHIKAAKYNPERSREKVKGATSEIDELLDGAISRSSRERSQKKSRSNSRAKARTVTASKPHKLSRAQVKSGLDAVSRKVRKCGQGRASGIITVEVVVKGNGRVARAQPNGSFAGTPVGVCVARAVRRASFPEFTGPRLTIQYPYRF